MVPAVTPRLKNAGTLSSTGGEVETAPFYLKYEK